MIEKPKGKASADIQEAVRDLVHVLVTGRDEEVIFTGRGGRLTVDELRTAITQYGRTLIDLPRDAWALIDTYEISGESDMMAADAPLWTLEEGRSDLTLFVTVKRVDGGVLLEIDDLRVL